jgi:glycosyltransferase involved in cell wall biosynthesis
MKIVHITEAWSGGIATYAHTLMQHQLQSDKFTEVSLIYADNRTAEKFDAAIYQKTKFKKYSYISSRSPLKFYQIAQQINKILTEIQPDIVHLHSTFPGVYGRIIKKFPTVYCSHGWSFVQEEGKLKQLIYANVEKFLSRKTDAIINISQHEHDEAWNLGVKAKINKVILSGVSEAIYSSAPDLHINNDYINLVFIGRLDYKKGFDVIYNIFRKNQFKNVRLYVVGEADRDSASYQFDKNIIHLGWIDNRKIDDYIKLFDAVIMPSRYEGFGLVAIEAMRNAKPVIVSDRGALPELVKDGINGYVFNLDYAEGQLPKIIAQLDKHDLAVMGDNARKTYLDKFAIEKFVGKVDKVYEEVTF